MKILPTTYEVFRSTLVRWYRHGDVLYKINPRTKYIQWIDEDYLEPAIIKYMNKRNPINNISFKTT